MKRGQSASGAAVTIALIAGFIVLYLLFIPSDLRDELLSDGTTTTPDGKTPYIDGTKSFVYNETLLEVSPGRIDYLKYKEFEHPMPSVNLYTTTKPQEIQIAKGVFVKRGVFDKVNKTVQFTLNNLENLDHFQLSFSASKQSGRLTLILNGKEIYNNVGTQIINLQKSDLKQNNVLDISVSNVGLAFWTTNEYQIDQISIFYQETDVSAQKSKNTFVLSDTEKFNLEKSTLKYTPDCNPSLSGVLTAYVNNEIVFQGIPDCGMLNVVEFSPSLLTSGDNKLTFKSESGRYLIDQIKIIDELKKMTYPTYYFELEDEFFRTKVKVEDHRCGDVDGVCPSECDEDLDIDCCLGGGGNFWCDIQPDDEDMRCSSVIKAADCSRCLSGYEDVDGNPPNPCEGLCGDDKDNKCPGSCNKLYDEDCCFEEADTNYWCDDVPKFGISNVCENSISAGECDDCPSGYRSESGKYDCKQGNEEDEEVLSSRFDITLTVKFTEGTELKEANVYVNGHKIYVRTRESTYSKNIDNDIEKGTNSIRIEPVSTSIDIRELLVEVKE